MVKSAQTLACHRSMLTGLSHCTHENTACCACHFLLYFLLYFHTLTFTFNVMISCKATHPCMHTVLCPFTCTTCRHSACSDCSGLLLQSVLVFAHDSVVSTSTWLLSSTSSSCTEQGQAGLSCCSSVSYSQDTHTSHPWLPYSRGGSDSIATVIQQMGDTSHAAMHLNQHNHTAGKSARVTG